MTDKEILRDLAKRYADIASPERFEQTARLHRAVNDLKMVRPVVLVDELPWHEMNIDGSLDVQCDSPGARNNEIFLRRKLYINKYLPADALFPPYMTVGPVTANSGEGLDARERTVSQNDGNHIVAHEYYDQLSKDEDLGKIKTPVIEYFPDKTREEYEKACDIFGDILPVKKSGAVIGWAPWDNISRWRGVTPLLVDLNTRPEFCHALMKKLLDNANATLDAYEQYGLMTAEVPQLLVHCTPALCSDLAPCELGTAKSVWGRGMAQIFASVSPEMHDAFDMQYMVKFLSRFGVSYYGCCEPLHTKMHVVKKIPNLRKIGVTPWANADIIADESEGRYVLSFKQNPAYVAVDNFERQVVSDDLNRFFNACRRTGASCDVVLKDISSCNKKPENIFKWAQTAMEAALAY